MRKLMCGMILTNEKKSQKHTLMIKNPDRQFVFVP